MSDRYLRAVLLGVLSVLEGLPGMLISCQMFLLSMLFAYPVRVGGSAFQFGGALVILVMRSVVISG
jgi:hypothetical protein